MTADKDLEYRRGIAETSLREAEAALQRETWWLAGQQGQMAVENAAKAVCAHFGPVPRTHDVEGPLSAVLEHAELTSQQSFAIEGLTVLVKQYGREAHIRFSYGDEENLKPPAELITRVEAERAVEAARRALELAREFLPDEDREGESCEEPEDDGAQSHVA